jgi:hypothetical protein
MRTVLAITAGVALGAALAAPTASAQSPSMPTHGAQAPSAESCPMPMHQGAMSPGHPMSHMGAAGAGAPGTAGQAAFAAIAEVVRLLDADPGTDWSKVDLERLRQHLIDMDEVVMRARVTQAPVPGGLAMEVTGAGRTEQAIRAMVMPHAAELDRLPPYAAKAELIPGGVRLTVTARAADDARAVARLRGLGFVGLLTEGAHHGPHHLAMARGGVPPGHSH